MELTGASATAPRLTVVEVSLHVEAPPDLAYDLVSDVTQMGRWSPETSSCRWLGAATGPAAGARFRGTNRLGWRRWSTTCTVTVADPGRCFEFDVSWGWFPIATWSYLFAAEGAGTVVTERWRERRPTLYRAITSRLMGVADRGPHNRATMETTLHNLRAACAEGRH